MQAILATEGEVALYIGKQFQQFVSDARGAGQNTNGTQVIRDALAVFRGVLVSERRELINQELALYAIV